MNKLYQFLFSGSIKRLRFFLITLVVYAIFIAILLLGAAHLDISSQKTFFYWILPIPLVFVNIILSSKRLRDIGLSPWFSLLILLTPIGFIGNTLAGAFQIFLVIKKGR